MTTWFTSDLHFGHANIIQYSGRPFHDVDHMNWALIERWNALVQPDDTVWVMGDVAMGRIDETLPLVRHLLGHKRLLTGNHDRCWDGHGAKAAEWINRYEEAGFEEIHQGSIELSVGGYAVVACHFPYSGDSQEKDRYPGARPIDDGRWLLHGHVHELWRQRQRMINVGSDAWAWRPVDEATIVALIEAGPNDLQPISDAAAGADAEADPTVDAARR